MLSLARASGDIERLLFLLVDDDVLAGSVLVAAEANLVPGQREEAVHALEVAATRLGHEDPDPDPADDGDGREAPECALG